jgi:flagellum-specific ATP synthase
MAAQRDVKDLVEIGAYVPGTNPLADKALALADPIRAFLTQDIAETAPAARSWAALQSLVAAA